MAATGSAHPESLDTDLQAAAIRQWGEERCAVLGPSLRRLAEALATVAAFPLSPSTEPYPTGPEAPRG